MGEADVGVIASIYCIPKRPSSVPWAELLGTLAAGGMVQAPYRAGSPYWQKRLRAPFWLMDDASTAEPFELVERAWESMAGNSNAMISAVAPAAFLRSEPQHFYSDSSDLGLYRFAEGYTLSVGEPEDWSDMAEEFPDLVPSSTEPEWQGKVTELLWIYGKNAPLEEDFLGSPLHALLETLWPEHTVLADVHL